MNTQDPYRDLSEMKRNEYPGYDEFVPYTSDWRYGVGFLTLLMAAGIAYSFWMLQPEAKVPIASKTVVTAPAAIPTTAPAVKHSASPQVATARSTKDKVAPKQVPASTTAPAAAPSPKPAMTLTAPPSHLKQ